jgi:hypothetical protein
VIGAFNVTLAGRPLMLGVVGVLGVETVGVLMDGTDGAFGVVAVGGVTVGVLGVATLGMPGTPAVDGWPIEAFRVPGSAGVLTESLGTATD